MTLSPRPLTAAQRHFGPPRLAWAVCHSLSCNLKLYRDQFEVCCLCLLLLYLFSPIHYSDLEKQTIKQHNRRNFLKNKSNQLQLHFPSRAGRAFGLSIAMWTGDLHSNRITESTGQIKPASSQPLFVRARRRAQVPPPNLHIYYAGLE